MKVYISSKKELWVKRFSLFILGPGILSFSVFILYTQPFAKDHEVFYLAMGYVPLSLCAIYAAIKPSVLLIDNDKIILKGAINHITYAFNEFDGIKKKWLGYAIFFTDGNSFSFSSRRNQSPWYFYLTPRSQKIADLNNEIKDIIKARVATG